MWHDLTHWVKHFFRQREFAIGPIAITSYVFIIIIDPTLQLQSRVHTSAPCHTYQLSPADAAMLRECDMAILVRLSLWFLA